MLTSRLTHPDLAAALAAAGHGARVLIADGNYPVSTKTPPTARRIYLNLTPGVVSAIEVLNVLVASIPIEAATVMMPASGSEPSIFAEFRRSLANARTAPGTGPSSLSLELLGRDAFYAAASAPDVAVAIATGEGRVYANLLLTIGVVPPPM
jgi:L-fucose mutarotase